MDPLPHLQLVPRCRFTSCTSEQECLLCHQGSLGSFDGWVYSVSHITLLLAPVSDKYSDIVLWLTYFYKSNELPIRLAFFWTALSTSNIVGSLLAAGILQMRGVLGWGGWRWL